MDWNRAIEINHAALTRIVAALVAMVECAGGLMPERLQRPVYRAVLLVLRPAESAVRRLIVIAARDIVAKPYAPRLKPSGLGIRRSGGGRMSFQLFDPPVRCDFGRRSIAGHRPEPRIFCFAATPFAPVFRPAPQIEPDPEPDDTVDATHLGRRLAAVRTALDTLPRQVNRLKRWQARRERMPAAKYRSLLRPGRPPGYRRKPRHDVDAVLIACHGLAIDVLRENTS